jgi:hypothetical protein
MPEAIPRGSKARTHHNGSSRQFPIYAIAIGQTIPSSSVLTT